MGTEEQNCKIKMNNTESGSSHQQMPKYSGTDAASRQNLAMM